MELTKHIIILSIILLTLTLGCIDNNPLTNNPIVDNPVIKREVKVDLSTPEGVVEAKWRHIENGDYEKAADLYCGAEYMRQVNMAKGHPSFLVTTREDILDLMNSLGKSKRTHFQFKDKHLITEKFFEEYLIGEIADEGYWVNYETEIRSMGLYPRGTDTVVKFQGKYCIADSPGL